VQVQAVAVDPHFTWKTPMGGVEAGQVFDAGLIGQVVERDDVQIALATLIQGAQHATADAAVTVEGNFVGTILGHLGLPGYTPLEGRRLEAGRKSSSVPPAVHPPAYRLQRLSVFEKFFSSAEYVVDSEAEHLEQLIGRSRFTEGAHADDAAFQADVLVPEVGVRGFDGNARGNFHRQYGLLVGGVLGVEHSGRRHGHHAHLATLSAELLPGLYGQADFRTGGDEDQLRLAGAVLEHVTATGDVGQLLLAARLMVEVLTAKHQSARTLVTLDGVFPGDRGFHRV